jgi:tripartite-type tricarboxylate transporter receptor subunit TctC
MRPFLVKYGFALGCVLAAALPGQAQDFYKGKTITVVVGNTPGGGFDANGRLLARHMGRFIPGAPEFVVSNMPGASSQRAVQYLDQAAPRDGTVMTIFNFGLIGESRLQPDKVRVDFTKYNWIGSIGMDIAVCYMWHAKGARTLEDVRKIPEVVMGLTNVGTSNDVNQRIMSKIFGVKLKQVAGYPGSAELRLATERGELDGDCGAWGALPAEWIAGKKIYPFLRTAPILPPDLPADVPYAVDIAPNRMAADVIKFLASSVEVGRPFIMSAAVPAERVNILREAFDKMVKDAQFAADAAKLRLPVMPRSGEEALEVVRGIYAASPEVMETARRLVND